METQRGILTKLGLFSVTAISLFIMGKKHIASYKDQRHRTETDARIDSDDNEFAVVNKRPGFPSNNPNLDYGGNRESKYFGSGSAYASRTPGDRLTMFSIFDKNDYSNPEQKK